MTRSALPEDNATASGNFLKATERVPEPDYVDEKGQPTVPFETNLKLTLAQETKMIEHAFQRLDDLEKELGRDKCRADRWYETANEMAMESREEAARTFFGKRHLYDAIYANEVDWREHLIGGIFSESNLTVPLSRRIDRQMVARFNNYFFGTDPWMAAYPVGVDDAELADLVDQYSKYKAKKSKLKGTLEAASKLAFTRGEAIVKTTPVHNNTFYKTTQSILVDENGEAIQAQDGELITQADLWIPVDENSSEMILERDGVTPKPPKLIWATIAEDREITHYKGPQSSIVYFKDFLCPLTAASVEEADVCIHLYDMSVDALVDDIMQNESGDQKTPAEFELFKRKVALVRELASEDNRTKSAKNTIRSHDENAGDNDSALTAGPTAEFCEIYMRFDANEDGIEEEIMIMVDRNSRAIIFYDYLANVTPDGTRPFDVVRVNDVDGRWYGVGCMEMFETSQEIIDLMVNRWNKASGEGGRVTFWNPSATLEGRANPHLKMNWGQTYTLAEGKTVDDALQVVYLENIKHNELRDIMEFFLQIVMNESGVQHANDANMVGLDQAKLATGIRNIEKSGQEMFSMYLSEGEMGMTAVVQRFVKVLFYTMEESESFQYFDGKQMISQIIGPQAVANIQMDVRMELTRYRGEQQLQSNMTAADMVERYFSYPPELQERLKPFFVQMLKALEVKDAESILQPLNVMLPPRPGNSRPGAYSTPPASGSVPPSGQSGPNI